jgi:hypothetical protein
VAAAVGEAGEAVAVAVAAAASAARRS